MVPFPRTCRAIQVLPSAYVVRLAFTVCQIFYARQKPGMRKVPTSTYEELAQTRLGQIQHVGIIVLKVTMNHRNNRTLASDIPFRE